MVTCNTTSEKSKITDETNYYFTKLLGLYFALLLASTLIGCRRNSRTGTNVTLDKSSDGKF